ncbi:MAG: efflux RND transporter periplasmic adaptor subunit [Elusimicrobia bacterium]|nr:efflux RND transporter periplasmic adaptor subunit [Elusimicrobiota bacterium]MBI2916111.1 efflux RND transporter periplasmic adaptor subunit [Elusimicrobiota bacterium]
MTKNKKVWVVAFITVLALGAWGWNHKKKKSHPERWKPVTAEKGEIALTVLATGIVQPQNRLEIKPPIPGRLESLLAKEGDEVKKGQILAWLSSTERAALLDAARAQGESEAARWEKVYRPTPLVSPMDGILIARNMEPGQTVTVQEAPFVLSDRLIVKAQVDETDIGLLKTGLKTTIVLDAYPSKKISGSVGQIAFEAKTVNNVTIYEVDVLPEAIPSFVRSGMTANVTFLVRRKENVLTVPQEAVQEKEGQTVVLVPAENGEKKRKFSLKPVHAGLSDGKKVEIVEGLSPGDTVLVSDTKWERKGSENQSSNPLSPFSRRR